ncbi:hypothetical protein BLJAPNOD_06301 [Ensifer sp. M14]|uniref:class I SAM-dependent methyltransferase n=1 Tax=Ensifer sp. M14 TaxID=2203782 RepID=UPI000E1E1393|nr:class I SAM-dependent methyltransferase [Ensifer sp. M14]RDL47461.1 hypothetical protein BLJAPNOD_06301 [Ensifer sp. M14]
MQDKLANHAISEAYNLACTPLAFMSPHYQATSAWHEHLPLAFWLIESLRPRTVVELGTHYGVSFFAFCQAIKVLRLETSCYAVDTWQGDEHSGEYDDGVYSAVVAHNDAHYAAFSRLVRSTFDRAAQHFRDGEIDLLHIDGHHSYESVRRDFETWLPRMSDSSVVLLHDTNVRERGFGVFRLLDELKRHYPHFEFVHGHGLAIIGTGKHYGERIEKLFELQTSPTARLALLDIFSRLGRTCADTVKLKDQTAELFAIDTRAVKMQEELAALHASKDADRAEIDRLNSTMEETQSANAQLRTEIDALADKLSNQCLAQENRVRENESEASLRFEEIAILTKMVRDLEYRNNDLGLTALDEIRKAVRALATTGPQKYFLGKGRLLRAARALEVAGFLDADWYREKYADVAAAAVSPSRHYLEYGISEGRLPNPRLKV